MKGASAEVISCPFACKDTLFFDNPQTMKGKKCSFFTYTHAHSAYIKNLSFGSYKMMLIRE